MLGSIALFVLLASASPQVAPVVPAAAPMPTAVLSPSATPPTPLPSPTVGPTSSSTAGPSPGLLPSPSPTPLPVVTPSPAPTPLVLPPNAAPQIIAMHFNQNVIHSGEIISRTVTTSTNVASVEVRIAGYSISLPRTDFGEFVLSYQTPHIPRLVRGNYTARIIARNTAGVATEQDIPVALR